MYGLTDVDNFVCTLLCKEKKLLILKKKKKDLKLPKVIMGNKRQKHQTIISVIVFEQWFFKLFLQTN